MQSETYIRKLRSNKIRVTPGRQKIIEIFCKATSPLSAENLIKKTGLNKTSVYREVNFLIKDGFLNEVDFSDRIKRYELKDLKHHHHLICLDCKNVEEVVLEENLEKEEERIRKVKNFHISKHNLEFFGYCQKCI